MPESKALEALFPGPERTILRAAYSEPERWWAVDELAGRAGLQTGSLRRHADQLCQGRLLREKREGGRVWFQADPECPVFAELQSLVYKLTVHSGGRETILVVEDQPATARITSILLESWGYDVLEAHCAGEAIAAFEERNGQIHLLLTDVNMPGMDGPGLAVELQRRRPGLRVIYMSGYAGQERCQGGAAFLLKPFNPARLSKAVRRQLDREPAGRTGEL